MLNNVNYSCGNYSSKKFNLEKLIRFGLKIRIILDIKLKVKHNILHERTKRMSSMLLFNSMLLKERRVVREALNLF